MGGVASSADIFRAVADPTRRALLDLLREADCSVGELARPFRMTQPAISQHLRVLREAGLIRGRPAGRQRLYRLNTKPLQQVYEWAAQYRRVTDPFGHVWAIATTKEQPRRDTVRGRTGPRGARNRRNPKDGRNS